MNPKSETEVEEGEGEERRGHRRRLDPSSPAFLVGMTFGCLVGVPLTLLGIEYLAANTVTLVVVWSTSLILAGATLCALYLYRERVIKRLFGVARAGLEESIASALLAAECMADGRREGALKHFRVFALTLVATYSWAKARLLAVGWLFLAASTLLVFVGANLAHKQNELIEEQTRLVEEQTGLAFAQNQIAEEELALLKEEKALLRSQRLRAEMDAATGISLQILEQMTELAPLALVEKGLPYRHRQPHDGMVQIVSALAIAVDPAMGDPSARPPQGTSRQRGVILETLLRMKVDLSRFGEAGANFDYADLTDRNIPECYITLRLGDVDFSRARLDGCFFEACEFRDTTFSEGSLRDCTFNHNTFVNVSLDGCDLRGAEFDENGVFENVTCRGAKLSLTTMWANGGLPDADGALFAKVSERGVRVTKLDVLAWAAEQDWNFQGEVHVTETQGDWVIHCGR